MIAEQSPQARTVPVAAAIAGDLELDRTVRMRAAHELELFRNEDCPVDGGRRDVDSEAELGSIEIEEIVEELLHARPAVDQPGRGVRYGSAGIHFRQVARRHLDGLERAA